MKIISIRGNKVTIELTDEEHNILFRHGLQKWIDKKVGPNKAKVLPVDPNDKEVKEYVGKPLTKKELKEEKEFVEELIGLAFNTALEEMIDRHYDKIVDNKVIIGGNLPPKRKVRKV